MEQAWRGAAIAARSNSRTLMLVYDLRSDEPGSSSLMERGGVGSPSLPTMSVKAARASRLDKATERKGNQRLRALRGVGGPLKLAVGARGVIRR